MLVVPRAVEAGGFVELTPKGPAPSAPENPNCGHAKGAMDDVRARGWAGGRGSERTSRTGPEGERSPQGTASLGPEACPGSWGVRPGVRSPEASGPGSGWRSADSAPAGVQLPERAQLSRPCGTLALAAVWGWAAGTPSRTVAGRG